MDERSADVVVIGAGPAGMAAACASAAARHVVVLDSAPRPGGQIWRHRAPGALGHVARRWLGRFEASDATFHGGVTVTDVTPDSVHWVSGPRHGTLRAGVIILATGARERFLPFPGWTLPGVTGVGGVQALIKSGASVRDLRIVLAGSGPLLLPVAATCVRAGADVRCVAEQASARRVARFASALWREPAKLFEAMSYATRLRDTWISTSSWIRRVARKASHLEVELVTPGGIERIECDLVGTGFGLVPASELGALAGCQRAEGRLLVSEHQQTSLAHVLAAGEATGIGGAVAALAEGTIAGLVASGWRRHRQVAAQISPTRPAFCFAP